MKRRILATLLSLCLLMGLLPTVAIAADEAESSKKTTSPTSETTQENADSQGRGIITRTEALSISADLESQDMMDSEGWSWNSATKTLTLGGLQMSVSGANGITVPDGTTILLEAGTTNSITVTGNSVSGIEALGGLSISTDSANPGSLLITSENSGIRYVQPSTGLISLNSINLTISASRGISIGGAESESDYDLRLDVENVNYTFKGTIEDETRPIQLWSAQGSVAVNLSQAEINVVAAKPNIFLHATKNCDLTIQNTTATGSCKISVGNNAAKQINVNIIKSNLDVSDIRLQASESGTVNLVIDNSSVQGNRLYIYSKSSSTQTLKICNNSNIKMVDDGGWQGIYIGGDPHCKNYLIIEDSYVFCESKNATGATLRDGIAVGDNDGGVDRASIEIKNSTVVARTAAATRAGIAAYGKIATISIDNSDISAATNSNNGSSSNGAGAAIAARSGMGGNADTSTEGSASVTITNSTVKATNSSACAIEATVNPVGGGTYKTGTVQFKNSTIQLAGKTDTVITNATNSTISKITLPEATGKLSEDGNGDFVLDLIAGTTVDVTASNGVTVSYKLSGEETGIINANTGIATLPDDTQTGIAEDGSLIIPVGSTATLSEEMGTVTLNSGTMNLERDGSMEIDGSASMSVDGATYTLGTGCVVTGDNLLTLPQGGALLKDSGTVMNLPDNISASIALGSLDKVYTDDAGTHLPAGSFITMPNGEVYFSNGCVVDQSGRVFSQIMTIGSTTVTFPEGKTGVINEDGTVTAENNCVITLGSGTQITVLAGPVQVKQDGSIAVGNGKVLKIGDNTEEFPYGGTISATGEISKNIPSYPSGGGSNSVSGDYIVSVNKTTNGKVVVSPSRADKGDTVTITVKPNTGYELDKLIVTDKNDDTVKLTDKGNGKFTFTMPGSKVEITATFVEVTEEQVNPFSDVTTNDFYYDAVLWAVDNGVTGGTSATTFSPNVTVTRAQMVTFLWRAHGSPKATGANPFTDVSTSDYYYDAVLWAVANGVTSGTSADTFGPDAAVTRAQAVTFQWRAAGSPVVSGSSFDDVSADAYYVNAVTWAVANGITNGTSDTTFSPDVVVSRAQAVTFLHRELG